MARLICQAAYQLDLCTVPEKKRAVILPSVHKPQNQEMQVRAVTD
jgi:hypothetical protein